MKLSQRRSRLLAGRRTIGRTAIRIALAVILAVGWPFTVAAQSDLVSVEETRSWAQCVNGRRDSGAYRLSGWKVGARTTAHLNMKTVPGTLRGATRRVLQASFDVWRAERSVPRITVAADGRLARPTANRQYDLMFARLPGSTLAMAHTWRWTDGLVESDVVFNSRLRWFVAPKEGDGCYDSIAKFELGNIATHEFGHVYGLGHARRGRFETMHSYSYTGETLKRSPGKGDVAGIKAVY